MNRLFRFIGLSLISFMLSAISSADNINELEFPELDEIEELVNLSQAPAGIVFTVMEDHDDALEWVLHRLEYYVAKLRQKFPSLDIAVVAHGDEILSLPTHERKNYPDIHNDLLRIIKKFDINFHICETFAQMNGLDISDFPDYVDVVPFGPSKITDYRSVGYHMITMEYTW